MGAVDLVVQVESPGSVASGLQRIGRAGHQVGEPSKGKIFPKYRGDLLEAAVVAERMLAGAIEETRYPRNPLDVLAQQIVAMCAVDEWRVDDLDAARPPCGELRRALATTCSCAVLDLLAGRYPTDEFAELRPRLVWDRAGGTRPRARGRRPARDHERRHDPRPRPVRRVPARRHSRRRARRGDGVRAPARARSSCSARRRGGSRTSPATAWSSPRRPGEPGQDAVLARRQARAPARARPRDRRVHPRAARSQRASAALARLRDRARPRRARRREPRRVPRRAGRGDRRRPRRPHDRRRAVPRRDRRLAGLRPLAVRRTGCTPRGDSRSRRGSPNGSARARRCCGATTASSIRLPEAVDRIPVEDLLFDPDEIEEAVVAALPGTALFASVFREAARGRCCSPAAARASAPRCGSSASAAPTCSSVAAKHPTFPILLETTRECLRDVFDVPALREVLADLRVAADASWSRSTPSTASPFAQSLLFGWVAVYMYEGDAPLAERRAAALSLDRDLLRELLGAEELRELLDPRALAELELELQRLAEGRRARDRRRRARPAPRPRAAPTEDEIARARRRRRRRRGSTRLVADGPRDPGAGRRRGPARRRRGRGRAAATRSASSLPDRPARRVHRAEPSDRSSDLVARYARTHGAVRGRRRGRARLGAGEDRVRAAPRALEAEGRVVHGEFRPGGVEREWCDADVLRRLRRRSLAALRKEVEPVDARDVRAVPARVAGRRPAARRRRRARRGDRASCRAPRSPPRSSRPTSCPRACAATAPPTSTRCARAATSCGWAPGALGADDGRVALVLPRPGSGLRRPRRRSTAPTGQLARRAPRAPRGARRLVLARPRRRRPAPPTSASLLAALWDLVWAGEVTNDTLAPLRAFVRGASAKVRAPRPGAGRARARSAASGRPPAPAAGRSSRRSSSRRRRPPRSRTRARCSCSTATACVTREAVLAEGAPGGFAGVYPVLKALEEAGKVRRGYFVAGLGAAQFALPGAVDRLLRAVREAQARRAGRRSWRSPPPTPPSRTAPRSRGPQRAGRPCARRGRVRRARRRRARRVPRAGRAERCSRSARPPTAWADALVGLVKDGRLRRIELRRIDGEPVADHAAADRLRAAGFADGYRGLTARG